MTVRISIPPSNRPPGQGLFWTRRGNAAPNLRYAVPGRFPEHTLRPATPDELRRQKSFVRRTLWKLGNLFHRLSRA